MAIDGTWRSLVARTLGVREVPSSNLGVPTINLITSSSLRPLESVAVFLTWQTCGREIRLAQVIERKPVGRTVRKGAKLLLANTNKGRNAKPSRPTNV